MSVTLNDLENVLQTVKSTLDSNKKMLDVFKEYFTTNPALMRSNSHVVKSFSTDTDTTAPVVLFDCKQDSVFLGQPPHNLIIVAIGAATAVKTLYINSPTADGLPMVAGTIIFEHEIQKLYYTVSSHAAGTAVVFLAGWVK